MAGAGALAAAFSPDGIAFVGMVVLAVVGLLALSPVMRAMGTDRDDPTHDRREPAPG